MAISKQKKVEIVEDLGKKIAGSETVVFVDFHGLSVARSTELRRRLREQGVGYQVVKKTLLRRAINGSGRNVVGNYPEISGEVALAYLTKSDDVIAPAKGIYEFQQSTTPDEAMVKIVGGIFEGEFVSAEKMNILASIPSRDVLYAKLVHLLNSPIQRLVLVLDQVARVVKN